jgi:hypothetical protein
VLAMKVIKNAKNGAWWELCSSLGRETQLGNVWKMLQRMMGKDSRDNCVS